MLLVASAAVLLACPLFFAGCGGNTEAKGLSNARDNLDKLLKQGMHPNEMGMVMVLEYHRISDTEGDFTRSIDNFKN